MYIYTYKRQGLGRAMDPHAWRLAKFKKLKSLSFYLRELIRRERRDGGEARGNEEREKSKD